MRGPGEDLSWWPRSVMELIDSSKVELLILSRLKAKILDPVPVPKNHPITATPVPGAKGLMHLPVEIRQKIFCMVLKTEWILHPVDAPQKRHLREMGKGISQLQALLRAQECLPMTI